MDPCNFSLSTVQLVSMGKVKKARRKNWDPVHWRDPFPMKDPVPNSQTPRIETQFTEDIPSQSKTQFQILILLQEISSIVLLLYFKPFKSNNNLKALKKKKPNFTCSSLRNISKLKYKRDEQPMRKRKRKEGRGKTEEYFVCKGRGIFGKIAI